MSHLSIIILNKITNDTLNIVDEIKDLSNLNNSNEMNLRIVDLMLENKVISVDIIQELVEKGKLNIKDINVILNKYKGE